MAMKAVSVAPRSMSVNPGRRRRPRAWLRSPKVLAGLGLIGFFVLMGVFGPLLSPSDPSATSGDTLAPPSLAHLFGTTATGGDVLSQVLTGARLSLEVGFVAAAVSEALAVIVGITAGYLGGLPDEGLSVLTNVFLVIPVLPLQILLLTYLGNRGWVLVALVIALTAWPHGARKLRAQTLSLRRRDYVEAARAVGEPVWRIVGFEILPNELAIIVTGFLFHVTFAIIVQSSLAFLGLGDLSAWSWGTILHWASDSNAFLLAAWWWYVPPGLCLALLGMGLAMVNLGIDEVINPRLRGTKAPSPQVARAPSPLAGEGRAGGGTQTPDVVLTVRGLDVDYGSGPGAVHAVNGVDLTLRRGEVLGIAGESGSGKSTVAYAITRLLRHPGHVVAGEVRYVPATPTPSRGGQGVDVLALSPDELRRFRWAELAVVFQAAMHSLNPVLDVTAQLTDTMRAHKPELSRQARFERARELVSMVGLDPGRLSAYPHQLSGGQRQRVMIAMALALEPEIIVLDEPTTALDVVVQRAIVSRLVELRAKLGCSLIFITHDLSLLAEVADSIAVMYAGKVVEAGPAEELCSRPAHPYTTGLLSSFPPLRGPKRTLVGIKGSPPDPRDLPSGCPFHQRCPEAVGICSSREPALRPLSEDRSVACLLRTGP